MVHGKQGGRLAGPAIFAAIVLPVLAVGVFSYAKTKRDLTELAFAQKRSTAHLTAITVKEKFDRLKDIGLALATRVQFRRLVAEKKWEKAIQILEHVPKDFPFVERVFLADGTGVLRADAPELPGVRGKSFSHRDWYRGVLTGGQIHVSDVYTRSAAPHINVVAVATPIKGSDGGLKGILVLQISLRTLFDWAQGIEVGPGGFVYFVDRRGLLAGYPLKDSLVDYAQVPVVQRLMGGKKGVEVLYNPIEKEERLSAYEPVPGYGWGVVAQQPTSAAFAERDANLRRVLLIYGFVFLLSLFLSFLVRRAFAERQRNEETLRASEERFRSITETATDAVVIANQEGIVVLWNKGAQTIFGYSPEEIVGQPLMLLMPERYREAHQRGFQRFLQTGEAHVVGKTVELHGRRKDGGEFPLELSLTSWKTGGEIFFSGIIRNITERKRVEEALRRSEEKYRALFDFLDVGICTIEVLFDENNKPVDYRFLEVNSSFEKQTGIQNAPGRRMREIAPLHEEHWFEIYGKIALTGEPLRFENEAAQLHRWYDVYAFRVGEPQKRQVVIHFNDITERKRIAREIEKLDESLRQQAAQLEAANKELEAFSYSVSHDLRAPLRSIDGFSQALLEDCHDRLDESGKDYLGRVRGACLRMAQLIDDLLELSRVSRSEMRMETVDLSTLAGEIADELAKQVPERKTVFVIADNLKGEGDARLLRVALENLLGNAWKYSSKHSTARIEFGAERRPEGETVFFVRDDGAGFDMAYASKLFGAFQRLHGPAEFAGTGIGLATVQRIIHRHGGRVWAEGAVERGATFYFTL